MVSVHIVSLTIILGLELDLIKFIKSNQRLGAAFTYSLNNIGHDFEDDESGIYYQNVKSHNTKISFKLNYSCNLLNNSKSALFIGPEIGISYFHIKEQFYRVYNIGGLTDQGSSDYWINNRIAGGFLIEYVLREIIMKGISLSFSLHPDLTIINSPGLLGTDEPALAPSLNFNVGIKYRIK